MFSKIYWLAKSILQLLLCVCMRAHAHVCLTGKVKQLPKAAGVCAIKDSSVGVGNLTYWL